MEYILAVFAILMLAPIVIGVIGFIGMMIYTLFNNHDS